MKGCGRAGHSGKSHERREVIGGGGVSGEESSDRREVIGGGGFLGKKSRRKWGKREGGKRGGEMGFREKDGEEFDEV